MSKIRHIRLGFKAAIPAIVMAAGTITMFLPGTPPAVIAGAACLLVIAVILADLQNNKKMGYTGKITAAMQKIPGLKNADEGEILAVLTWCTSLFLGGPETLRMLEHGINVPSLINNAYNYSVYPLAGWIGTKHGREFLERKWGKEITFCYRGEDGEIKRTQPSPTALLLQQIAFLIGAIGITAFGAALDVWKIEYTGLMFALSNGITICRLTIGPTKEIMAAKWAIS